MSAYVTSKTLLLESKNLVVKFEDYPPQGAFQSNVMHVKLGNPLQAVIKYFWRIPSDSAFALVLPEGYHYHY